MEIRLMIKCMVLGNMDKKYELIISDNEYNEV
jgi:hypothetical protein